MEILKHDEGDRPFKLKSPAMRYSGYYSVYENSKWVPIQFDYLDYIDCDKVVTHPIIIEFNDEIGHDGPIDDCGEIVGTNLVEGEERESLDILKHGEEERPFELRSPAMQYSDYFAVYENSKWVPIQFDYMDYIDCDKVVTHPVIIEFNDEVGHKCPIDECGEVVGTNLVEGEKKDEMSILKHDEGKRTVKRVSSIDQYAGYISVYERGGWTPIQFDYLDYIDCDKVVSHPVVIEFDDKIGYQYQIDETRQTTDEYMKFDFAEVTTEALPEFMGEGFYERYDEGEELINFDNGNALGVRNDYRMKVGTDYIVGTEFLPPAE